MKYIVIEFDDINVGIMCYEGPDVLGAFQIGMMTNVYDRLDVINNNILSIVQHRISKLAMRIKRVDYVPDNPEYVIFEFSSFMSRGEVLRFAEGIEAATENMLYLLSVVSDMKMMATNLFCIDGGSNYDNQSLRYST